MKIQMKDNGDSPEFGPYEAGDEIDETRASPRTMQTLIDRGLGTEVKTASTTKARSHEEKQGLN